MRFRSDGAELTCKFCGGKTRPHRFTARDLERLIAAYMTHLVQSHWDVLEAGRRQWVEAGVPAGDGWTRL